MPSPDERTTDQPDLPPLDDRRHAEAEVWRLVFFYGMTGVLWIALSDSVVAVLWADPEQRAVVSAIKGWLFVGCTALLLYVVLMRGVERRFLGQERESRAREAHDQMQTLLQSLVDGSPDAIFAKDAAGRYQLFNQAAARVVGRDAADILGLDDCMVFGPVQGAMIRSNDLQVMSSASPATFEELLDTATGPRTFLATKGPLRSVDGRVTGLFGISRDISERSAQAVQRQRLLDEANQARDLLRDVLARIGDGFAALDSDWRFTYVNAQGAVVLGHPQPETLVGRHLWTEFPGVEGSTFQRILLHALQHQQPAVREDYYARWHRWFEFRVYPSLQGVSVYFSDITARRQAVQALQISELRYRLAARHGQVWDWSADTGELKVAPEFWQAIGVPCPSGQHSREAFEKLLHPQDLARFRQALVDHLRQRGHYGLEFRMRHADGGWRWFQTQGQAMWDAQGHATYMAGTTFDITERKQAEEALRESEAYRRLVFEQLADGVLLVDRTLMVLDANAQALSLLGYSRGELLRLSLHALLAEHERARLQAELGRLLSGQSQLDEWEHLRRDGTRFPAEVSMRSLDGRRHVLVLRDIRVRRASERALLTYQLELSELTRRLLAQEKLTTQRVAQSLHDQVGQTLAVVRLHLDAAHTSFGATMPEGLHLACDRIAQMLDQAVREVRQVLADLRPPLLEEQGLAAAIDNEIRSRVLPVVGIGNGADVLVEAGDDVLARRWPADVEYGFFMVAREAIANARQHAGASLIRVLLSAPTGRGGLDLCVIDDGRGIPAPMLHGRPGHLGIVGMRERAIAIGARFAVSHGIGRGTEVSMHWEEPAP